MKKILYLFILPVFFACHQNNVIPKPKALLSLEYPTHTYQLDTFPHFIFEKSVWAQTERISDQKINLNYPQMKAKVYLTYKPVKHNLIALLRDAEKFTYEHTVKADEIITRDFVNPKKRVYATLNYVTGNAASQVQFHITDSLHHFVDGSLYFYALPNYDSIMPAVKYLEKDINHLLETFTWKNNSKVKN